jgi:hypothetical protein
VGRGAAAGVGSSRVERIRSRGGKKRRGERKKKRKERKEKKREKRKGKKKKEKEKDKGSLDLLRSQVTR